MNPAKHTRRVVVRNIGKLYTCEGLDGSGKAAGGMAPISPAELEIESGRISHAGPDRGSGPNVPDGAGANPYPPAPEVTYPDEGTTLINVHGALVTPGLVDPHTHVIYGGDRSSEMALKLAGVPYLEVLARGGGILSTVRATREASDEDLFESAATRLRTMLCHGTTTVEIKSGYGLSTAEELRLLRLAGELARELPMTIVPTFLGAHAVPAELRLNPEIYVDEIVDRMIPAVVRQGIAQFCDVFCEPAVFGIAASRRILQAAKVHGLGRKIHADEIEIGGGDESGAQLAAEVGATSADHLRATNDAGLRELSRAGVVPVVLPATSLCLRDHHYANARVMIDQHDLPVALATDDNPGTSPTESLQLVMGLAALELRMTPEEILAGVTVNAARAIGLENSVGTLEMGKAGDAVIWQTYDLDLLSYRLGVNQAAMVIKSGTIVSP